MGPDPVLEKIVTQIAAELKVRPAQVQAAVALLDGGATVPFIARYRKEATDGLDDVQLRELQARLDYLRELEQRRDAVLRSIEEQGKLTPELRAAIEAAPTKQELEDLYLPYKPRRRTKGMIAREAGIEPLADRLFADPMLEPLREAQAFVAAYPGGSAALAEAGFADALAVLDLLGPHGDVAVFGVWVRIGGPGAGAVDTAGTRGDGPDAVFVVLRVRDRGEADLLDVAEALDLTAGLAGFAERG